MANRLLNAICATSNIAVALPFNMGGNRYIEQIFLRIVREIRPIDSDQWNQAAIAYHRDKSVSDKQVRSHKAFAQHFSSLCSSADHAKECVEIKSLIKAKKQALAENVDNVGSDDFNNNAAATNNSNNANLAANVAAVLTTPATTPPATHALAAPSDASSFLMIESVSRIATQTRDALEELWDRAGMPPDERERERMYSQLVGDFQKFCDLKVRGAGKEAGRQGGGALLLLPRVCCPCCCSHTCLCLCRAACR